VRCGASDGFFFLLLVTSTIEVEKKQDHVGHIVAGENHRRTAATVALGHETPQAALHRNVQPQRRLVEEQDGRTMDRQTQWISVKYLRSGQVSYCSGIALPKSTTGRPL